jgi:nucleoside-diphosphate-sugar epimerase
MGGESILVTGAAGFTGRHFITAANAMGHRCIALCRDSTENVPEAANNLACDLLDRDALLQAVAAVRPSMVVHLAAISFVAHENTTDIYDVNLLGTLNLLDAISIAAPNINKVLIASSANIYGNANSLPITEETPPSPVNHYGVSKYAMEMGARLYSHLPIIIARPFNYTGVGQDSSFLIPKIVDAFRKKKQGIELGNLDVSRDFSDVRDTVQAYLRILDTDNSSRLYNICSGGPTSLSRIIEILNALAGYQIEVTVDQALVRNNEIKVLFGSAALLESDIGNFRSHTIEDTLAWMLSN